MRQALTSGRAAGHLSAGAKPEERIPEPELLDASGLNDLFPLKAPFSVQTMQDALTGRTDLVVQHLGEIVSYCLEQTDMVARELGVVSLPQMYARVGEIVEEAVVGWVETVCVDHPAFVRTMRGSNPPEFLEERARIDRIVAKVAAKRSRRGA